MRKTVLAGMLAGLCMAATTVVAGGVQAMAGSRDCPDGYVCVWGDSNYEGRFVFVHGTSQENVGSRMNDLTTSLWNRTDSTICFCDDAGYGGALLARVAPGDSRANLERGANDRISSWRAC
ncbi:peptidase inhibitor family I36 protein [Streptomyces sp. NPDC052095]|uniref:peptidase inhibitor family I36 protein n=1 Tax=unclassified Streptomyces TaxID=2593676 RepID=UPI00344F589D